MAEISVKMNNVVLHEINFRFNINEKHPISLKISHQFRILSPKNKDNNSALVSSISQLTSIDSEEIFIKVKAKADFEFSDIPEDYDEIGKEKCFGVLQDVVNDKIDEILNTMGLPKFNLNKN